MQHTENKGEYGQLNNNEDKSLPQDKSNRSKGSLKSCCPTSKARNECAEVGLQIINKGSVGFAISKGIMSAINRNVSCSPNKNQQTEMITTTVCVGALMLYGLYNSRKILKENRMKLAKETQLHLNAERASKSAAEAETKAIEMIEQSDRHHEEQKAILERQHKEQMELFKNPRIIYTSDLQAQHLLSYEERDKERAQNAELYEERKPHAIDLSMPDVTVRNSSCCQG